MTTESQIDTQEEMDGAKMEAFAGQFISAVNGASLMALVSVGKHTRLFDSMTGMAPSTSEQIADAAGLNERYVREWLGGLVLSHVVEYEPSARTYRLPAEHAAFLTTAAGPNNLAVIAQIFPYMGLVQDELIESFHKGGGVPYSSFPAFQEIQAEMTGAYLDAGLVEAILPLAPGVAERLQAGGRALDIGCGAGHASNLLAAAFPAGRFSGYDFSSEGIEIDLLRTRLWIA